MSDEIRRKNALVTGGTDGIGKEVARGLARVGHRVVVIGRDLAKGRRAESELRESTKNSAIQFLQADLSLMSEAKRVADEVASRWPGLSYLVHSAGLVRGRRVLTAEGVESNFAINYLSRFVLTQRLLPLMEVAGQPRETARIVIIGGAAQSGTIHFDDVNFTSNFGTIRMLGQVCQSNDVFTIELARRLATPGGPPRVTIACLKIGVVRTNTRYRPDFPWWMKVLAPMMDPFLAQTPQQAAASALKVLLAEDFEGVTGALFLQIRKFKQVIPGASVTQPATGTRLWELSEQLSRLSPAGSENHLPLMHTIERTENE
jgi:NAD(P)-dependent dehydrogenase (short-subunit alcohol dehydrogenase family)